MNLKPINKFLICLFLLFLYSCESLEILSDEKEKYDNESRIYENKTKIILNIKDVSADVEDFYNFVNLNNFDNKKKFTKIGDFKTKRKKNQNSKNLISFIYLNQFIYLDLKSNLNIYDLKNFNLIKSIDLKPYIISNDNYPTSISRIKDNFFVSYSEGVILNFNLKGELIWLRDFKKIIKTPIKIFNNNIIVLLENDIISISSLTGEINWEFSYGSNEIFQAMGGDVISLNHLLFFILPNAEVGEINTIFREKNKSIFSQHDFKTLINNSSDRIHAFNNILTYFDQNKYLYSFDIGKNKILFNVDEINNIYSSKYFNNTILLLDKNNLLKSLNINNKKLFWNIDLSDLIYKDDKIIHVSSSSDSLIIIFSSGNIVELNPSNGNIISSQKLIIDKISHVLINDNFLILYHRNNRISLFSQ